MPPDAKARLKSLETAYAAGETIFAEGEETRELYILLSGTVEIRKGDRVLAEVADPDTYLGEMSTLLGAPRTATVRARTDCRLVRLPENKVSDFFAHSPALGIKLAKVLARRLQEMNLKYERLLVETANDGAEAGPAFKAITADPYRRKFLRYYREQVGREMAVKEAVAALEIPLSEVNRILQDFARAGLLGIEDRTIEFRETPNKALRQMILDWES